MKALGIILNVFFPGVGSLVLGKVAQGIIQIVLYFVGLLLTFTGLGAIIGLPLMLGIWIWGIVVAATHNAQPIQVNVINQTTAEQQTAT